MGNSHMSFVRGGYNLGGGGNKGVEELWGRGLGVGRAGKEYRGNGFLLLNVD